MKIGNKMIKINKVIPIVNTTNNQPAFFAVKTLNEEDTEDVVKMYDIIIMAEQRKLFLNRRRKNVNPL